MRRIGRADDAIRMLIGPLELPRLLSYVAAMEK